MTKAEVLSEIIYDLKMKGSVDFEVDECESWSADKLKDGYCIESKHRYMEVGSLTEARKAISKLGKKLLHL